MNAIRTAIQNLKPTLKYNSLSLYLRNLKLIYQHLNSTDTVPENISFLDDHNAVMSYINTMKETTKKNYLTAIIVALQAYKNKPLFDIYKVHLDKVVADYNIRLDSQQKSIKEDKNWTTLSNLRGVMAEYHQQLDDKGILTLGENKELSNKDFSLLQKWVVAMLYLGSHDNPPLRNDYAEMHVISKKIFKTLPISKQNQVNFLIVTGKNKKEFRINHYKTKDTYGQLIIPVSPQINKMLNIWLHYNTTPYLLLNSKKDFLSKNGLTKLINKVFEPTGKLIGASMIRHIFISDVFPADKEKRERLAMLMGHSVSTQQDYAKK